MNQLTIQTYLNDHPWGALVQCKDCVDSTNNAVREAALQNAPEGTCVLAEQQTGGKGRRGRSFFSPAGSGLYLSVLLRPGKPAAELMDLTARIAVCVRQAIFDVCEADVGIKWVNDICLNGKKIGGILVELVGGAVPAVVAGIGINCLQTEFPPELSQIAGSVYSETGRNIEREQLAAAILRNLSGMFETDWLPRYREACVTLGKQIRVLSPEGSREALALDITDTAALLVQYPDGTRETVFSGEVSVRGLYGYTT